MSGLDQLTITRMYRWWAGIYDAVSPVYLLGNEGRLRREAIHALHPQPGQAVLEIACGTGRNFPLIMERIGPSGVLVGVDYSAAMLARAQARVARRGWRNVRLIRADAARIALGRQFDAALCTLAMGVIPDYENALTRMVEHVRSGGRVAIADGKRSTRWYARPFNGVAYLLGLGAGSDVSRRPWETLDRLVDEFEYREWFMGFFYVATGRCG